MNSDSLGLVLKRFIPYKNKVSILDQTQGKTTLVSMSSNLIYKLWPGMVVKYNSLSNNSKNIITSKVNIIIYQQNMTKQSIHWFHSLVELCYYSLPLGLPAHDVFDFLCNAQLLLEKQNILKSKLNIVKKIYLLKLIELLGLSSYESISFNFKVLPLLSQGFIDFSNKQNVESVDIVIDKIDDNMHKQIDLYIKGIIKSHPYYKNFKVNYLMDI